MAKKVINFLPAKAGLFKFRDGDTFKVSKFVGTRTISQVTPNGEIERELHQWGCVPTDQRQYDECVKSNRFPMFNTLESDFAVNDVAMLTIESKRYILNKAEEGIEVEIK